MLRTTNRIVIERLKKHVLDSFEPEDHEPTDRLQKLIDQINYMQHPHESIYQTALNYVEGGSLLVYYDEQREFLAETLNETEEEANRYDNERVFRLYCHLVARTIAQLYAKGTK